MTQRLRAGAHVSLKRKALRTSLLLVVIVLAIVVPSWFVMIRMPEQSFRGPLPPLSDAQGRLAAELQSYVETLATDIGPRNVEFRYAQLTAAAEFIERTFVEFGYAVERQAFEVGGKECVNLIAEVTGKQSAAEIVVVGGHYDSIDLCPGANDNASGVAATLALARRFASAGLTPERTVRFVAFVNEEPPNFQTETMGSLVYARRCRERDENIVAMWSLETMGYYSEAPKSQQYPNPFRLFYPSTGNFIAFVGNVSSRHLVRDVVGRFRRQVEFPSEGAAIPSSIPGAGWSDHWSFWQVGYPALMVTDTAPFRYEHYHESSDTADRVQYDNLARVVEGLEKVLRELASPGVPNGPASR